MTPELITAIVGIVTLAIAIIIYVARTSFAMGKLDQKVQTIGDDVADLYNKDQQNDSKFVKVEVFEYIKSQLERIEKKLETKSNQQ